MTYFENIKSFELPFVPFFRIQAHKDLLQQEEVPHLTHLPVLLQEVAHRADVNLANQKFWSIWRHQPQSIWRIFV